VVLVEMNGFACASLRVYRGPCPREGRVPIPAVWAVKPVLDFAGEWEPASVAGGLVQRDDAFAASLTDEALLGPCMSVPTKLAALGVEERQKGIPC
jgi:hypothetical protein